MPLADGCASYAELVGGLTLMLLRNLREQDIFLTVLA